MDDVQSVVYGAEIDEIYSNFRHGQEVDRFLRNIITKLMSASIEKWLQTWAKLLFVLAEIVKVVEVVEKAFSGSNAAP